MTTADPFGYALPAGVWVALLLASLSGCDRAAETETASGAGGMGGMMQQTMGGAIDTTGLRTLAVPAEFATGARLFAEGHAEHWGATADDVEANLGRFTHAVSGR